MDHDGAYGNEGTHIDVFCLLDFGIVFNLRDWSFKMDTGDLSYYFDSWNSRSFETDTTKVVEQTDQSL